MSETLAVLREKIDHLDDRIAMLLHERATLAHAVKAAKTQADAQIFRPDREIQIIDRVTAIGDALPAAAMAAIFREIVSACRNLEQQLRVGYTQSDTTAFGAARMLCGATSAFYALPSTTELIASLENGVVDVAVINKEQSIPQSIQPAMSGTIEVNDAIQHYTAYVSASV